MDCAKLVSKSCFSAAADCAKPSAFSWSSSSSLSFFSKFWTSFTRSSRSDVSFSTDAAFSLMSRFSVMRSASRAFTLITSSFASSASFRAVASSSLASVDWAPASSICAWAFSRSELRAAIFALNSSSCSCSLAFSSISCRTWSASCFICSASVVFTAGTCLVPHSRQNMPSSFSLTAWHLTHVYVFAASSASPPSPPAS
mmetsp:Transcript_11965/g.33703  ORF Transcript_11965/g.33703 Transcript_11965/m.33703 type:complete len:200 (+) Transcript_11965:462-1061(+)